MRNDWIKDNELFLLSLFARLFFKFIKLLEKLII